jgi:hypothetical protein
MTHPTRRNFLTTTATLAAIGGTATLAACGGADATHA